MIVPLLRKELDEHRAGFALLGVLAVAGFALIFIQNSHEAQTGTHFAALRLFVVLFTPLAAATLGRSLIVKEYLGETQLFLEALPISRAAIPVVKFVAGLVVLTVIVAAAFICTVMLTWQKETPSPEFLSIIAARTFSFVLLCHAFFFATGFLGRYRIPLYIAAIAGLLTLSIATKFELGRSGPAVLVDSTFAFERHQLPLHAIATTLGLSLGLTLLGFYLALVREGSLAARFAERMSHREKVTVAVFGIGFILALVLHGERSRKQPFDLPGALVAEGPGVTVKYSPSAGGAAEQQFARRVCDELVAVREFLDAKELPPLFITTRRDFDPTRFEAGTLTSSDGVLVRINRSVEGWQDDLFLRWLIREMLQQRAPQPEMKRWILDGFPDYWLQSRQEAPAQESRLMLRALYGTREREVSMETLGRWLSFREEVGDDIARAVAWSVLAAIERRAGRERCRRFLRAALGEEIPENYRGLLRHWYLPLPRLLEQEAGLATEGFLAAWNEGLKTARPQFAEALKKIPRMKGSVRVRPVSPVSRKVTYMLEIQGAQPAELRTAFLHLNLPPLNAEIAEPEVQRETSIDNPAQPRELPALFSRGARLAWTFAVESPELGCEILSGWTRQEVE